MHYGKSAVGFEDGWSFRYLRGTLLSTWMCAHCNDDLASSRVLFSARSHFSFIYFFKVDSSSSAGVLSERRRNKKIVASNLCQP